MSYSYGVHHLHPTVRNVPLSVQIGTQLREQIMNGTWPIGTKVPGEHDLVKTFGTSRNTVREALRALVHLGLLESRPGDGTYVRSTSELGAVLGRRVTEESTKEVFEVREALEVQAARLAAQRITVEQIDALRALLKERYEGATVTDRLNADVKFHHLIVAASDNPLIVELHRGLEPAVIHDESNYTSMGSDDFLRAEHEAILDALAGHDPDGAVAATLQLLDAAAEKRGND
ncbi:FadR/GntR family transcriptional regulator [Arthrobacter woluwensis]|uniref:DNA-binding transcriptional regulator, FadR family n=1 Tax=Arthrobacter woluwensis TaxID=156980 RepID=A0A1H4JSB1_9MICC|nr:FadR/GntR family transcriptional regulator [Arthrobacter woluwensis]SEB48815.1 DNA-binding transcriptional regulator, FadR family [Arthrobacter woluwensis]